MGRLFLDTALCLLSLFLFCNVSCSILPFPCLLCEKGPKENKLDSIERNEKPTWQLEPDKMLCTLRHVPFWWRLQKRQERKEYNVKRRNNEKEKKNKQESEFSKQKELVKERKRIVMNNKRTKRKNGVMDDARTMSKHSIGHRVCYSSLFL